VFEANRSVYMRLSDFDPVAITSLMNELQTEATSFVRSCDATAQIVSEFKVYMRYSGQGWEIPVELSAEQAANPDVATFQTRFEQDYAALFGRTVDGMDIEITVWAVNATTPSHAAKSVNSQDTIDSRRAMFDPAVRHEVDAAIVLRDQMDIGQTVQGPAAITEDETTIILPSSRCAIKQPDGCIDVTASN